jgi:hypothetical protein
MATCVDIADTEAITAVLACVVAAIASATYVTRVLDWMETAVTALSTSPILV